MENIMSLMTPLECIQAAILDATTKLDPAQPRETQLFALAQAIIDRLGANGFTISDAKAIWNFHHHLDEWLNQDVDGHRLSTFEPYSSWLEVWRKLPPEPQC